METSEIQFYLGLIGVFIILPILANKKYKLIERFKKMRIKEVIKPTIDRYGRYTAEIWMPSLINEMYHLLIVASTGSGKTTILRAMTRYMEQFGKVYMISPKIQRNQDPKGAGYGANFQEIENALKMVKEELECRLKLFGEGETDFERLFLIIDEWTFISDSLPDAKSYLKTFSNVGREIGVCLIVSNQSANVEDLGISGAIRNNFSKLYLAEKALNFAPEMFEIKPERPVVLEHKSNKLSCSTLDCLNIIQNNPLNPDSFFDFNSEEDEVEIIQTSKVTWTEQHIKVARLIGADKEISGRSLAKSLFPGSDGSGDHSRKAKKLREEVESVL